MEQKRRYTDSLLKLPQASPIPTFRRGEGEALTGVSKLVMQTLEALPASKCLTVEAIAAGARPYTLSIVRQELVRLQSERAVRAAVVENRMTYYI